MKNKTWKTYAFWILFTEAVGALAGFLTREGTKIYAETILKPPLSPPGVVFPIVWTVLYALMGVGITRIDLSTDSPERTRGVKLYLAQLTLNFFWSIIFFNAQNFGLALVWLLAMWGLIILMILAFKKVDKAAALLQLPYLLWTTFAAYLNLGVWLLNK